MEKVNTFRRRKALKEGPQVGNADMDSLKGKAEEDELE